MPPLQIYEEVLIDHSVPRVTLLNVPFLADNPQPQCDTAILRTCRQIYKEGTKVLIEGNPLTVEMSMHRGDDGFMSSFRLGRDTIDWRARRTWSAVAQVIQAIRHCMGTTKHINLVVVLSRTSRFPIYGNFDTWIPECLQSFIVAVADNNKMQKLKLILKFSNAGSEKVIYEVVRPLHKLYGIPSLTIGVFDRLS